VVKLWFVCACGCLPLHVESCLCEILDVDKEMSWIVEALVAGKGKGARANRISVNFSPPLGLESLLKSINIRPCLQVYQIVCSIENWLAQNCRGRESGTMHWPLI